MICPPDRWRLTGSLAALLALVAGVVLAAPLAATPADDARAEAGAALERGDGVAAELAGKRALEAGAPRAAVAALIGEGEFLQGDFADAREWLVPGEFDRATHDHGFHVLARLEMAAGNMDAAAAAFDQILQHGAPSAPVAADIGRMRYRTGEHRGALEAAEVAMRIDPHDPQALQFMGQLTRESQGALAALPLLREAASRDPDNTALAGEYAATLGDAGEHAQMLQGVRAMVEAEPRLPHAQFLQAVLAARAGQDDLARKLWWGTEGAFDQTNVGLLVAGVLEYRSGNPALAVERFAQLRRQMPASQTAQLLFARALVANGAANVAVPVLQPIVERADAPPYAVMLLARAYEQLDQRELAAPLLDRVALGQSGLAAPLPAPLLLDSEGRTATPDDMVQQLRLLTNGGQFAAAQARVVGLAVQFNGSADLLLLAGDAALLAGDGVAAQTRFREAAGIRRNWPLMQRLVAVSMARGDDAAARGELAGYLRHSPRDQRAAAMLGRLYLAAGEPQRGVGLLRFAASLGSGPYDATLLADLAEAEQALGQHEAALDHARRAYALARGNGRVAQVLGQVLRAANRADPAAAALLGKVRAPAVPPATVD